VVPQQRAGCQVLGSARQAGAWPAAPQGHLCIDHVEPAVACLVPRQEDGVGGEGLSSARGPLRARQALAGRRVVQHVAHQNLGDLDAACRQPAPCKEA